VLLLLVSDDDREFVEVSLLNDEREVDDRDSEVLVSDVEYESVEAPLLRVEDVEYESVEAPLLRVELDVECDPELDDVDWDDELTSELLADDDDDDDDCICDSDELFSANLCTFRGGS